MPQKCGARRAKNREHNPVFDISSMGAGTQMIVAFFLLMALRVPVAFALGLSAMYAMWQIGFGFDLAGDLIATGIAKYALLADERSDPRQLPVIEL